ncbi:MAG: transposase [Candidatus Omnitrophica bacterium]|nr:transposase [Candidatus Omnitrophota bacterium]
MPRMARTLPEEGLLHVFTRGNNKRYVFRKERDFKIYLELLKKYKKRFNLIIYHYALMCNHIHLLCKICAETNLAKLMQGLGLSYSNRYRKRYKYTGQFWQGRYKGNLIEDDGYLLRCGLYIERNPVEAGLVTLPEEYLWSSYRAYAFGEKDDIVDIDPLFETLGKNNEEQKKTYRDLMRTTIEEFKKGRVENLESLGLQLE